MKTDIYTKVVLTIIAIALSVIAVQNMSLVRPAHAADKKMVADEINVNIQKIGGSSVYGALPVNLKEVGGSNFYGNLPVNIKEVSGSSVSYNGIPVNIQAVNGSSIYDAVPVKNK